MLIPKTKQKSASPKEESPYSQKSISLWKITDPKLLKQKSKEMALNASLNRPPEVWVGDGQRKRFRFLASTPVGIARYRVYYQRQWRNFTRPAEGMPNLFESELALNPSNAFIYEVLDYEGYTDKKGKAVKNLVRFFPVSSRSYSQLEMIRQDMGSLTEFDIVVSRSGSGKDTQYNFSPREKQPLPLSLRQGLKHIMKDFDRFYAPLPESKQRVIVNSIMSKGNAEEPY